MRKSAVVLAATAALTVVPAAAATAQMMLPPVPTHISTISYVDPSLVLVELDTSDGLRAALHVSRTTVFDIALGDYTHPITGVTGPYLRLLDCRFASWLHCGAAFISSQAPAPVTQTVTKTTATINSVKGAVVTKVEQSVTTVKSSVPAVRPPAVQLPAVPAIQVPAVPAPNTLGGVVSGVLGSVGATVDALIGTPPVTVPTVPAPAPHGLLSALLG